MKTAYVKVDQSGFELEKLKEATRILEQGGLVVFPTETVYGIAARADHPETIARLRLLKGRSEHKPFTIHVADVDDVFNHLREIPPLAMRVINKYWPGPISLVLPQTDGQQVGLRWPGHPVAQDLLRLCRFPVVAPSVNPEGKEPAYSVDMVRNYFDGKVDMVLDAGEIALKRSSTVLRVDDGSWEILREGPITQDEIQSLNYKMILFVCSGNTCRSPMAEGICKYLLSQRLNCHPDELEEKGYRIRSAGTSAFAGSQPSKESILAMKARNIDITKHSPTLLSLNLIDTADKIFTMTETHMQTIMHWNPFINKRCSLLKSEGGNVIDPYGGTLSEYEQCAKDIYIEVERALEDL